jgi:hypothetical protein
MTPAECLAKRNELNAQARVAQKASAYDIAARCRLLGVLLGWMAEGRPYAEGLYDEARRDFEHKVAGTGRYAPGAARHVDVRAVLASIRN